MASAGRFISDLIGTMKAYFNIGTIRLTDNSSTLDLKDKATNTNYKPVGVSQLKLKGSSSGEAIIQAPATASGTFTWPADDGETNEVLQTDGNGGLDWATVATSNNSMLAQTEIVAYNSSSPIVIFTPPANAFIMKVLIDVETTFDGVGANMSVGVAGGTSRYAGTTDVDLALAAVYEIECMYEEDGSPDEVIITFAPGSGAGQGSARVSIIYANPS